MIPARKPVIRDGGPVSRFGVAVVLGFLRALPVSWRESIARALAALAWGLRIRRNVALENLSHAFPEKTDAERRVIARGAYRHLALSALDSVTSDLLSDAELKARLVIDAPERFANVEHLMATRQPFLVASAHFGSWEFFAETMARRGHRFHAVVRPLEGAFNGWIVRARQQAGVQLILQRGALKHMLSALKAGDPVVQLIDQSLPARHAVFVPFFGRPAATTPSVSLAAARADVPVYVVLSAREGSKLRLFVEGPVPLVRSGALNADLHAHTARLTEILEALIRRHPEQWLWLHRRWKETPSAGPGARRLPE